MYIHTIEACQSMWLACYTQEEIADAVDMPRQTVADKIKNLPNQYANTNSAKVSFSDDFDVPLYNVWKLKEKTNEVSAMIASAWSNVL